VLYLDKKVKSFIENENEPHKKALVRTLIIILMVGLPTAFIGKGSQLTYVLITPMSVTFFIWCIYLLVKTDEKRKLFYLYMGLVSIYESIIFLLISYKMASLVVNVPLYVMILVIFFYLLFLLFNYFYNIRLVNKGYYLKHKVAMGSILGMACPFLGYFVGRAIIRDVSNSTGILLGAFGALIIVPYLGGKSINVLKYKYICQLEQEGLLQEIQL